MRTQTPAFHPRIRCALASLLALSTVSLGFGQAAPTPATAPSDEEPVQLSPFTVSTAKDAGYYADNTLAGSRIRTNISDLGASITVVTKQQMLDTASLDMNDVFLYESNTEGAHTYTSFGFDSRGAVQDNTAGYQAGGGGVASSTNTATRVRGIGAPDRLRDYYPSNQRIPFDVYNTESVEINRGPNSLLFGLGSAAGIVNQSASKANLRRDSTQVTAQVGAEGAYRAGFNVNRALIPDKLGIYVAALRDERGFTRKPSYDKTNRYFAALAFKPFTKTTIRGNFEFYDNKNRRPNYVTPRDFVSPWIAAGRPSYNPVTRKLTLNGVEQATVYDGNNSNTVRGSTAYNTSQLALQDRSGNTIAFDGNPRPVMAIEQGQILSFNMRQLWVVPATGVGPYTLNSPVRATKSQGPITQTNVTPGIPAGITFAQPGVTNKSIYDWDSINIISGNFGHDQARIYNLELEQEILPSLTVQAGWYYENYSSVVDYYISQQTGVTLYVDTNTVNLDGSANPNFGRPFIEITAPDTFWQPQENMTGRLTAAYELDLSKKANWMSWLGNHRLMGLLQENNVRNESIRVRPYFSNNNAYSPPVADVWAGNTFQNVIERRFYVGDTTGKVTKDPGLFPNVSRLDNLRLLNPVTNTWENVPMQEDDAIHFASNKSKQDITSWAIALQSYLLQDRLVTTLGYRHDRSVARTSSGQAGPTRLPNGLTNMDALTRYGAAQVVAGNTKSYGGVFRPLKSWRAVENAADKGSWLADAARNLSFTYNRSENFSPAGINTDFHGNFLPFPTGKGKDYGIGASLFGNKLVARINFYESSANNSRGALIAQVLSRSATVDDTFFRAYAALVTGTAQNSQAVADMMKLPGTYGTTPGQLFALPLGATQTVVSKGTEVQITYNPSRNWTMKFTGGKQEAIFSNIGGEYTSWIAERMPIWTTAAAPAGSNIPRFWDATGTTLQGLGLGGFGLGDSQRVQDYFFTNVQAVASTAQRLSGKVTPDLRKYRWNIITNYNFDAGALRGVGVGGAIRWEDKAAIGYRGSAPDPDGIIRSLDVNKPVYDEAQEHLDLWVSYTFKSLPWLGDKTSLRLQANVRDALESGGLMPIAVNPDGSPTAYRIVDSRQWYVSATFDF